MKRIFFLFLFLPVSSFANNVGELSAFVSTFCPVGWLVADGTVRYKVDYPELYAVLPPDSGKGFGTNVVNGYPAFAFAGLSQGRFLRSSGGYAAPFGVTQEDMFQGHVHQYGGILQGGGGAASYVNYSSNNSGQPTGRPISDGTDGTPRTGPETRPQNITVLYCVRSKNSDIITSTMPTTVDLSTMTITAITSAPVDLNFQYFIFAVMFFGAVIGGIYVGSNT